MVIDTDGSAFITKAEFDSLKNNFQAQIDNYNSSIDSKIDGAIAAYLAGIKLSTHVNCDLVTNAILNIRWVDELGVSYRNFTTASGYNTEYAGAYSLGFGTGDPLYPQYRYTGYYRIPANKYDSASLNVYPKFLFQDDSNEMKYYILSYQSTNKTDTFTTSNAQAMPLWALETEVGDIDRVLCNYAVGMRLYCGHAAAYVAQNAPGAQSNYHPADKNYGEQYDFWVDSGSSSYSLRPTTYGTSTGTASYQKYYYCDVKLHDYFGVDNDVIYTDTTGTNMRWNNFSSLLSMRYVMLGKPYNAWVGTVKNKDNQFQTALGTNTWGTGVGSLIPLTYLGVHTFAEGSSSKTIWINKCSSHPASLATPNYYSKGKIESYNNQELANNGLTVGLCDGAPLFRAGMNGLAHCKLQVTTSHGTSAPVSNVQVNIKKDKFSNSITGNGNTLKYTDANGSEIGYLQNLTSTDGKFDLYFKVEAGETYYIRVSPQEPIGRYYAKIVDAVIEINNDN